MKNEIFNKCTTHDRPEIGLSVGICVFDTTLKVPIWWNGNKWIDSTGNSADAKTEGTTENRPIDIKIGFIYKDTTINKLIVWDGSSWVNMDGTALS